jgi:hypothetical protein
MLCMFSRGCFCCNCVHHPADPKRWAGRWEGATVSRQPSRNVPRRARLGQTSHLTQLSTSRHVAQTESGRAGCRTCRPAARWLSDRDRHTGQRQDSRPAGRARWPVGRAVGRSSCQISVLIVIVKCCSMCVISPGSKCLRLFCAYSRTVAKGSGAARRFLTPDVGLFGRPIDSQVDGKLYEFYAKR